MQRISAIVTAGLWLLAVSSPLTAEESAGPPLVVLVRHAEPAADPGDDPGLSPAGRQRAQVLAAALRDVGATAILTSTFRRTRETAQPLAQALGIAATAVNGGGMEAHIAALAAAVRSQRGAVVVVGHSNTVPQLIAALGGPQLPDLCDVHDRMFVLTTIGGGRHFVRSRYGAAEPDPGPNCP
jgi:broad specificity phosphatase PhoE